MRQQANGFLNGDTRAQTKPERTTGSWRLTRPRSGKERKGLRDSEMAEETERRRSEETTDWPGQMIERPERVAVESDGGVEVCLKQNHHVKNGDHGGWRSRKALHCRMAFKAKIPDPIKEGKKRSHVYLSKRRVQNANVQKQVTLNPSFYEFSMDILLY